MNGSAKRAREHVEAVYTRYANEPWTDGALARAEILVAGWRLLGESFDAALVERFWRETLEHDLTPPARVRVLDDLVRDGSPRAQATLASLVGHTAFESVDPDTLLALVRHLNGWLDPDLIGEDELRRAGHPLGLSRVAATDQLALAASRHPTETRILVELLRGWRKRVVASVPRWTEGAK